MGQRSPAFDTYIAKAPPFARPILERIREAFHAGAPDLTETFKWSMPHFDYKGPLGGMAAFKKHVNWGFWKQKLMDDPHAILGKGGMGGGRVEDISEMPAKKIIVEYVRQAVRLNEEGVKVPRPSRKSAAPVEVPPDLEAALRRNKKARETFDRFPPSHRRAYVEWITEAKQEATRQRRLATTIEWLSEGKPVNWKYMPKKGGRKK